MKWKTCTCEFWDESRLIARRSHGSQGTADLSNQHVATVSSSTTTNGHKEPWLFRIWNGMYDNTGQGQPPRTSSELHGYPPDVTSDTQTGVGSNNQCSVM